MGSLMNAANTAEGVHQPYDPEFFSQLARIEREHFWFRTRNRVIGTMTEQITKDWPDGLQSARGGLRYTGNVLPTLKKACPNGLVVGMDLYREGLAYAAESDFLPIGAGRTLNSLDFAYLFDLIGAFLMWSNIFPMISEFFDHLIVMLKPGGILLLTVPAHQALWSYFDEAAHHCRRYELDDLRRKLDQAGFEIEFLSQFMASIYPLLWIIRRIESRRRAHKSHSADTDRSLSLKELRIVPVVNGLLTFILMQEARIIKSRIALPFGSSLIVAARRIQ